MYVSEKKEKKNLRGSGERDDVVAEGAYPCDAQLGNGDILTVCYRRQAVYELEVMSDILRE